MQTPLSEEIRRGSGETEKTSAVRMSANDPPQVGETDQADPKADADPKDRQEKMRLLSEELRAVERERKLGGKSFTADEVVGMMLDAIRDAPAG